MELSDAVSRTQELLCAHYRSRFV